MTVDLVLRLKGFFCVFFSLQARLKLTDTVLVSSRRPPLTNQFNVIDAKCECVCPERSCSAGLSGKSMNKVLFLKRIMGDLCVKSMS